VWFVLLPEELTATMPDGHFTCLGSAVIEFPPRPGTLTSDPIRRFATLHLKRLFRPNRILSIQQIMRGRALAIGPCGSPSAKRGFSSRSCCTPAFSSSVHTARSPTSGTARRRPTSCEARGRNFCDRDCDRPVHRGRLIHVHYKPLYAAGSSARGMRSCCSLCQNAGDRGSAPPHMAFTAVAVLGAPR
jgi:hypothetical protein